MTAYRRARAPGATWFFTANLADRRARLLADNIGLLRDAFRAVRSRHPFAIDAIVVLPDHLHAIWTLPDDDANYPMRWRLIKSAFSRGLATGEALSASRASKSERGIWQRRYWEHRIRDEDDLAAHVDYIHFNPVKHGHVARAADWPWSSFHAQVARGLSPSDWAGTAGSSDETAFGERRSPG